MVLFGLSINFTFWVGYSKLALPWWSVDGTVLLLPYNFLAVFSMMGMDRGIDW